MKGLFLLVSRVFFVFTLCFFFIGSSAYGQALSDITSDIEQYGVVIPGIACKTRTNNEATVRNLAHGVWNRDSSAPVALNCGWPAPMPWVSNRFGGSRISGEIYARFVRTANTPIAVANETVCNVSVSNGTDSAQNPSTNGVLLGTFQPIFSGAVSQNENQFSSFSTELINYPTNFNVENFMSAFCLLPRGVRLQIIVLNPTEVTSFSPAP